MRIMYVNDALAIWGGLERVLIEKANLLATLADYEVCLVTLNQGSHQLPYPINPKVRFYDLGIQLHRQYQNHGLVRLIKRLRLNRMYKQRLRQKIQEVCPDVIVCTRAELVSAIVKVKGDIPLVYESHTSRRAHEFLGSDFYTRFSLAVSGIMIPPMVFSSAAAGRIRTLSANGLMFIFLLFYLFVCDCKAPHRALG